MRKQVAFIGLGHIGSHMARSVRKAGFPLAVYDLHRDALREVMGMGAREASSPKDAAKDADVLIIMVKSFPQTEDVLFGADGAVNGLRKGAIVACMNTIGPSEVRELARRLAEHGVRTLDAPVSGGTLNAEAGTLTILASGTKDTVEDAREVLEAIGKRIFTVGEVGKGQILKMMNQLLCSVELVSISEALVLGAKAGVDGQTLYEVTKATSGNSAMFEVKVPKIIAGDFSSTGDVDIHVKDLEIVTKAARELGVPLVLTNVAKEILRTAQAMGRGQLDGCGVITVLEDMVGARPRKPDVGPTAH